MKEDKAKREDAQTPLEKIEAMWERGRQLRARKQYWYELQFQGWIKAGSRRVAKQILEEYFSTRCGINVPYDSGVFGAPSELGVSLEIEDTLAEITHTHVRILWFKPYNYNRP
ncbi:MAG: hypothetical protein NTW48_04240 [Chloroflexi bacterium]|nr:hypothetical protein [Chloroflexota bacterium]